MRIVPLRRRFVPRGTFRQIWRHDVSDFDRQSIRDGIKTFLRVPFDAHNANLARGVFEDLDLSLGGPGVEWRDGARSFRGRVKDGRSMRSIEVTPRICPGDVIYAGKRDRMNVRESMIVRSIYPQRLRAITADEAMREGVKRPAHEWWGTYFMAREGLSRASLAWWKLTDDDARFNAAEEVRPESIFAMRWIKERGLKEWRANPWVWAVGFEYSATRPFETFLRLEGIK